MTRGDKFLLAGLLFISLLSVVTLYCRYSFFTSTSDSVQAVITSRGNVFRRIGLTTGVRSSFVVPGRTGPSTVEVDGTRVRMLEASCAGRICVKQGWIGHPGQTIVCVPGEILIRIEGAAPVDAVTR